MSASCRRSTIARRAVNRAITRIFLNGAAQLAGCFSGPGRRIGRLFLPSTSIRAKPGSNVSSHISYSRSRSSYASPWSRNGQK
jgi:hypothetical protein